MMMPQQGACPLLGEEDVARALHLLHCLQSGAYVLHGILLAQGMVQVGERLLGPRLDASVLGLEQCGKQGIHGHRVGCECLCHEVELAYAVGVHDACPLRGHYCLVLLGQVQCQFVSQVGIVALAQ